MGDMTKNFSRREFACKGENCCGHSSPINPLLVEALQELRDYIGKPISITSGFRCITHNRLIGKKKSYHTLGLAVDCKCKSMSPDELAYCAEYISIFYNGGIGIYSAWVHLDIRGSMARWK